MGLYTIGLQLQQQAASAGVNIYPQTGQPIRDTVIIDEFQREALNPTGAVSLYTTSSNDGNGTGTMLNGNSLRLTTDSSAIGDDVSVRLSEMVFSREAFSTSNDARSQIRLSIVFTISSSAADTEGFLGLLNSFAAITALPTTAAHLGVFWDISAGANFTLTSADGSTQSTTDTGEAVAISDNHRLDITWSGTNSALLEFFVDEDGTTPDATQTVTALGALNTELHFFCQTEAAAAKVVDIFEWYCETT